MKLRHLKFVWGASNVIKGHWFFGLFALYDREEGQREDGLAISVRGALLWTLGAAVAVYLAGATALFWFWQRNPYSLLTYGDALLRPGRGASVRDKQGQAFIAQGTDALRAKKWAEGRSLLQLGLALHPTDRRARLTLAQFYVATGQRPAALTLLQDGLGRDFPGRPYLQVLLDAAEQGEDYDLVVRLCDRFLPALTGEAAQPDRRWLRSRQFSALIAARHFREAIALADLEPPGELGNENRVLALLGLGRTEAAEKFLAEWRAQPGAEARQILPLQVRAFREVGQFEEMDRALAELRARSPADPGPAVYGVSQHALAGQDEAARKAFDDYLFRFGGSAQNLHLLAESLSEIGNLALLERCVAAAAERGYAPAPFQMLLVQAQVQRGEWAAAVRVLAALPPPTGRDAEQAALWRDWILRLVAAATSQNEAASLALREFLRSRPMPLKLFRKTIEALRLAGRPEAAQEVIALAAGSFPASAWLQTQRTEVAGEIAARRPAAETVGARPLPEKVFFARLNEWLSAGQWTPAEQMIHEARTALPPPDWLEARDGDLRFAQMQISLARSERSALLAAASLYLNGDHDRSQKVLDLGRDAFANGDKDAAIALAKEVLQRSPDFPPAQRWLRVWQPKPAPAK